MVNGKTRSIDRETLRHVRARRLQILAYAGLVTLAIVTAVVVSLAINR